VWFQERHAPFLLPHLAERVCQIESTDLFRVLELEELVAAMPCHVDQDVAPLICHQPLAARCVLAPTIRHEADEVFHCNLIPSVVHLDVVSVQVKGAIGVVEDGSREGVARVTGHVVRQHEDNLRVWDAEALDCAVERENICKMAVVEPET
jgi:hypothetical protein